MFEKNLYLVIQLPISNDSSIVVLENYENKSGIHCNKQGVREIDIMNPSLLAMNTHESYAFSDRLVEYILGNVIHKYDPITQNIKYVQTLMSSYSFNYKKRFISGKDIKGVWDHDLSNQIFTFVENNSSKINMYDQDGYFNKDVQKLMYSGGNN